MFHLVQPWGDDTYRQATIVSIHATVAKAYAALDRIDTSTDVGAIDGAELIVEAVTEKPDLKFDLFRQMDAVAGQGVILATNTSSISITEIAAQTKRPESVIGMHFMNPVPVMKLVELIRGIEVPKTSLMPFSSMASPIGQFLSSAS